MSIGKRIIDLARSNVTDFRAAFSTDRLREVLNGTTEPEVEPEIDKTIGSRAGRGARRVRDAAEDAWDRAYENARTRAGVRGEPLTDPTADRKRWYRILEVDQGADLKTVRRGYRKQLLQYHPDRYASDPEKQKAATEVTRKLTDAYNGLTRYLGG